MEARQRLLRLALLLSNVDYSMGKIQGRARGEVAALAEDSRMEDSAENAAPADITRARAYTEFCSHWLQDFSGHLDDLANHPAVLVSVRSTYYVHSY